MEAIKIHVGKVVPLMNDNIDTDQIIPKSYLKRIEKKGFGEFAFDEWRYLPDRSLNPDFILNKPEYSDATILVTGDNFGCGSSREHAAWALQDYRFKVILAGSYGDIFYMNSTKNGLLPIVLPLDAREMIAELPPEATITIDLPNQQVITPVGTFDFDIDATWKEKLVNGLDDIDLTLEHEELITKYEEAMPSYWK